MHRILLDFSLKKLSICPKSKMQVSCAIYEIYTTANNLGCGFSKNLQEKIYIYGVVIKQSWNNPCIADRSSSTTYINYSNMNWDFET